MNGNGADFHGGGVNASGQNGNGCDVESPISSSDLSQQLSANIQAEWELLNWRLSNEREIVRVVLRFLRLALSNSRPDAISTVTLI